jgi:hypothetical protein
VVPRVNGVLTLDELSDGSSVVSECRECCSVLEEIAELSRQVSLVISSLSEVLTLFNVTGKVGEKRTRTNDSIGRTNDTTEEVFMKAAGATLPSL